jgi:Protein of unknown function (DUF3433)
LIHQKEHPYPLILRFWPGTTFVSVMALSFAPLMFMMRHLHFTLTYPWLPVFLATFIRMMWTSLDYSVRQMEPFYLLARGDAPKKTLLHDYRGTPYLWLPVKALFNGNFIIMSLGIGSILLDVLTFLLASLGGTSAPKDTSRAQSVRD